MLRRTLSACLVAALLTLLPATARAEGSVVPRARYTTVSGDLAVADPIVALVGIRVVGNTMSVHYHAENIPADDDWTLQFSWDGCSGGFNRNLVTQAGTFDGSFDVDAGFVGSGWKIQTFPGGGGSLPDIASSSLDPRLDFACGTPNVSSFTVGNPPPAADPVQNTVLPAISGTPRVGVRLTASPGTWSPAASYAYQWLAGGTVLAGQTAASYVPTASVRGKRISVRVTASKAGYASSSATSAQTATVAAGIIRNTVLPSIAGTKRVGSVLTARAGSWTPGGLTYRYQWFKGSTAIRGATARTLRLPASVRGTRIRVRVTAVRTGYTSLARYSSRTSVIR